MLETRLLRRVIHYIWECYRERGEMKIHLKNHKGDELQVEERAVDLTVVVRYFVKHPNGALVAQMEVVCFILRYGEWLPLELGKGESHEVFGTADAETGYPVILDVERQRGAALFCDAWALRFLEEGFLATAAKHYPLRRKPAQRPSWPQPTVPPPSLEQIEEWAWKVAVVKRQIRVGLRSMACVLTATRRGCFDWAWSNKQVCKLSVTLETHAGSRLCVGFISPSKFALLVHQVRKSPLLPYTRSTFYICHP